MVALAIAVVAVVIGFGQMKAAKDDVLLRTGSMPGRPTSACRPRSSARPSPVRAEPRDTELGAYQAAEKAADEDIAYILDHGSVQGSGKEAMTTITGLLGAIANRDRTSSARPPRTRPR